MTAPKCASALMALVLAAALTAPPAAAQTQPATAPAPPRIDTLPVPPTLKKFPTPEQVVGRLLTLEEAVAIALDNAPKILASVSDYVASVQAANAALSPLLPQVTGQWFGIEQRTVASGPSPAGQSAPLSMTRNVTSSSRSLNTVASVTASQLLWDFGKTWASHDAAKSDS